MKVSKVVLVVVALHVLVIGGFFVFEGCSRTKSATPQLAGDENQASATNAVADTAAVPADSNLTANAVTPAPVAPAPVAEAKSYTVKKGDSLYKIAKAEKVTMEHLAKANNLSKTSVLKIGQKLTIPTAIASTASTTSASVADTAVASAAPVSASGNVYEVKSGDSLWKIAKAKNTTVAALKQANNLSSNALKVGQKLTIPSKAMAATSAPVTTTGLTADASAQPTYIVAPGDTLAGIAKNHGVKIEDIMKANGMTSTSHIKPGDKLVIPSTVPAPTAPATSSPAVIAPGLMMN